ncbi:Phosphate-import ATP-binding protein PhnC [compost metagenome]
MDLMIDVQGLRKAYGDGDLILKDVSVKFAPGEFVTILGLSGAGKSTFLRCLNRLIEPTGGSLMVPRGVLDGSDSTERIDMTKASSRDLRLWRRRVGMIFQQFNLVKRMSVLDNVLSGTLGEANLLASIFRSFPKADRERALHNLERVGLLDQAYQRADTLSGGQQQRVAIARALMQRPKVILADEPVASLDPKLSVQVLDTLKRVAEEDGITVLVSLHVLDLAKTYGDRIIGFQGGRIVFDGKPEALSDNEVERIYFREGYEHAPATPRTVAAL